MDAGRIEQLGTPEEIYEKPRSEFVARFIGASNVLAGKVLDAGHVSVAGTALACAGAPLVPGTEAAISIRQHEIRFVRSAAAAPVGHNVLPATITRNVFLGSGRDYMVELADGSPVRIVTAPHENFSPGSQAWLSLPTERCRVLER
jgi:iron(III) transport system ATP-binding protein